MKSSVLSFIMQKTFLAFNKQLLTK